MDDLDRLETGSVKAALEAMLLASTDPTPATDFAKVLGVAPGEVVEVLADLSAEYQDKGRGIALREVAGGWRLFTAPDYHEPVEALVLSWDTRKLSQAALETLAVIAYLQPVTRDGVRAIRGVNSDGTIASLVDKGLVREMGRDPNRNQAILYGTTRAFLERFGLRSPKDLPPLEDFAPDEETRRFITERLLGMRLEGVIESDDGTAESEVDGAAELEAAEPEVDDRALEDELDALVELAEPELMDPEPMDLELDAAELEALDGTESDG